jgi:hypothetical protein
MSKCRTVTMVAVRYLSNVDDISQYTVVTGGTYYWKEKTGKRNGRREDVRETGIY